jgi:hypothetical protein
MMKKIMVLIGAIILSIILAGIFGILHDQVTYSISHEYFTKFKFFQFGLANSDNDGTLPNPRQAVSVVGFLATWWVGIFIGLGLGLTGLIFIDYKKMFKAILIALAITFFITIITSFIGFLYGKLYLTRTGVDWWLPDNLIDKNSFITVGSIHNFSYLGGFSGLVISIVYLIRKNKTQRSSEVQSSS